MASGTIQGSGYVYAKINWSSSAGTAGSTVSATLYCQNRSDCYLTATCYGGYDITINGNKSHGDAAKTLSNTRGGSVAMMSHSVWVSYTGNKSITISGWIGTNGIYVNGSNIGNVSASGTATLDKVGTAPTMGSVTAPSTSTVSEKTTSITVKWNKANSYNNSCTYAIGCSKNGGSYSLVYPSNNINTTSYTWNITPSQGDTYKFAVCCANDIGGSSWQYSGTVTINKLNPPTIGNLPSPFNPYSSTIFTIPLTGGSQTNGGSFMRRADVFMDNVNGQQIKWYCGSPSYGNTSIGVTVPQADIINALGTGRYSANIYVIAWIENSNGTRSDYTIKGTTVNINTDGGATPTLGAPTISGGALGYPATCHIAGVGTVNVSSPAAGLRRAPSGTTISYKIACTGATTQNGMNVKFSNLTAGVKTIAVTATDSRGLSWTVTKDIRIQPYGAPTIRNYTVARLDNPQTSVKLSYTLNYSPIYSYKDGVNTQGDQLNTINTQQYSKDNSTWTNASNGGTITGLSTESVYTIYLRCSDKVKTTTYTSTSYKVPTIVTNMAIREWGVGLNCVPQTSYALDVSGNAHVTKDLTVDGIIKLAGKSLLDKLFPIGAVYITYNDNNPGNFLGGTWERFGQGRTLVGEGTGNDGSTSMSFTTGSVGGEYYHQLAYSEMPAHGHEIGIWDTSGSLKTSPWEFMTIYGSHHSDGQSHNVNSVHINGSGDNIPHNNVQPYLVVFFWRRVK